MATAVQTYRNHAHRPTQTLVAALFAFIAFVVFGIALVRAPSLINAGLLSLAIAVLALVSISRAYIVRLQDRIIRVEMQRRLDRLGLDAAAGRLSMKQLVALRFASDAELPALVARTMTENLAPNQIKQSVTDWQPDLYRT
jgi:hypothetical protein